MVYQVRQVKEPIMAGEICTGPSRLGLYLACKCEDLLTWLDRTFNLKAYNNEFWFHLVNSLLTYETQQIS
ncbi:hypothetical protein OIU76_025155 [Salix suchowensis]|nr:hypothetical protein OIU76_025155 [Salix suchowensis]